jgi:hypothetical protein
VRWLVNNKIKLKGGFTMLNFHEQIKKMKDEDRKDSQQMFEKSMKKIEKSSSSLQKALKQFSHLISENK